MSRHDKPLTGNTRYRVGFRKRIILQVEVSATFYTPAGDHYKEGTTYTEWRDAKLEDLSVLLMGRNYTHERNRK